jgi:hypothetical protein
MDWTMQRLEAEKRGMSFEAVDRINQVRRAQKPSFLGTGLKIASAGLDSYSAYKKGGFG